jgi:hypothetical protein
MTEQSAARAPRASIGPGWTMVIGMFVAFIGGMILTDDAAWGALILAIGAVLTQVGIIATAVEWAIRRTRES